MRRFLIVGLTLSMLAMLCLMACATARKAICPRAEVVSVTETETAYIVTIVDDCQQRVVKVAK